MMETYLDDVDPVEEEQFRAEVRAAEGVPPEDVSVEESSDLAILAAEMERDVAPPVVFNIPSRPGFQVQVRTDLSIREVNQFRKQATVGKKVDEMVAQSLTIAGAATAILKDGRVMVDDGGEPIRFGTPGFMRAVGARSAADAVRRFVARDGDASALAVAILNASGFGEQAEEADPTFTGA